VVEDLRKEVSDGDVSGVDIKLSDFRVEKTQLLEENAKGKEENRHLKKAMVSVTNLSSY
jgi:hypothetical protein